MLTHRQLRARALGRADVKAQFDELGDEYLLLDEFLKARSKQGSFKYSNASSTEPAVSTS